MTFEVINNPAFVQPAGFSKQQFKMLDQLYCLCATYKILTYRTVECNFDDGFASYTYYKSSTQAPYLQFIIRKVGPRSTMFELYKYGKGRIAKSSVFERVYDKLCAEFPSLRDC